MSLSRILKFRDVVREGGYRFAATHVYTRCLGCYYDVPPRAVETLRSVIEYKTASGIKFRESIDT